MPESQGQNLALSGLYVPAESHALIDRDMDIEGMGKLRVRARFRITD